MRMWMCMCEECVDALRLDIFMSHQSMFVALILFSFLMSKQKHERNVEWRVNERKRCDMCLYLGYICMYIFILTHTHTMRRTYSEKLMTAIEKDEAKLQTKNGRSSSKWGRVELDSMYASFCFDIVIAITNSIYTWIWKFYSTINVRDYTTLDSFAWCRCHFFRLLFIGRVWDGVLLLLENRWLWPSQFYCQHFI